MKITGIADSIMATKLAMRSPDLSAIPTPLVAAGDELACSETQWTISGAWSVFHIQLQTGFKAVFGIHIERISGHAAHIESEAGFTDKNGNALAFARDLRGDAQLVIPPDNNTPWLSPGAGGLKGWPLVPGGSGIYRVTIYGMEDIPPA